MANKTIRQWDSKSQGYVDLLYHDNGDGTHSIDIGGANVTVNATDLQIGAVEIKDDVAATRANVKTDGVNNALVITQNSQPLPTGAATSAKQDDSNTLLGAIDTDLIKADTDHVTIVSSTLPAGAATAAKQDTGNTSLASLDAKLPAKGSAVMTGSTPVTLATDDDVAADIDGIETNTARIPALGQAAMAASVPVALASDQSAIPTNTPKSSTANTPSILTAGGDAVLAANAGRKSWRIQNLGTNVLFIRLAVAGASSTVFHVGLKGGTLNDDMTGGIVEDEQWTGAVSIAGTSPRYILTELT